MSTSCAKDSSFLQSQLNSLLLVSHHVHVCVFIIRVVFVEVA
jgi:hypothetical protein